MLECNISYIANWCFGPDYMAIASNALQKVVKIVLRKWKYLNYGNYVSFSSWDQGQIGVKLGTKHVIYLKLASVA